MKILIDDARPQRVDLPLRPPRRAVPAVCNDHAVTYDKRADQRIWRCASARKFRKAQRLPHIGFVKSTLFIHSDPFYSLCSARHIQASSRIKIPPEGFSSGGT